MIIKRPSIFIYVNNPDAASLRDVCAGIEEEGAFYEIKEMENALLDELPESVSREKGLPCRCGAFQKAAIPRVTRMLPRRSAGNWGQTAPAPSKNWLLNKLQL